MAQLRLFRVPKEFDWCPEQDEENSSNDIVDSHNTEEEKEEEVTNSNTDSTIQPSVQSPVYSRYGRQIRLPSKFLIVGLALYYLAFFGLFSTAM